MEREDEVAQRRGRGVKRRAGQRKGSRAPQSKCRGCVALLAARVAGPAIGRGFRERISKRWETSRRLDPKSSGAGIAGARRVKGWAHGQKRELDTRREASWTEDGSGDGGAGGGEEGDRVKGEGKAKGELKERVV